MRHVGEQRYRHLLLMEQVAYETEYTIDRYGEIDDKAWQEIIIEAKYRSAHDLPLRERTES